LHRENIIYYASNLHVNIGTKERSPIVEWLRVKAGEKAFGTRITYAIKTVKQARETGR